MTVSIRDIARYVGVSHQVVSKVLNGGRSTVGASAETRRRINQAAQVLGYRPNAAGQALRQGTAHSVGVLMSGPGETHLPQNLLEAIGRTLAEGGYTCSVVYSASLDLDHLLQNPLLRSRKVDALLASVPAGLSPTLGSLSQELQIPILWLDEWLSHDAVHVDEADATEQLVEHLAQLGRRRILFLDYSVGRDGVPFLDERRRGFHESIMQLGLQGRMWKKGPVPREDRFAATAAWLGQDDRPDAVICTSLSAAQAVLGTALHMGVRVPHDLAIASYSGGNEHRATVPGITSVIRPNSDFGVAAARMAMQRAKQPHQPIEAESLRFTLDICGSTDPQFAPARTAVQARLSWP